jgi:hypothetical protein
MGAGEQSAQGVPICVNGIAGLGWFPRICRFHVLQGADSIWSEVARDRRYYMRHIKDWRPAPGTVLGSIAIFISLGGVSYGVATGSIDGREIKNNSVASKDIKNNSVRGKDIRTGTVRGSDVGNGSLTGTDVKGDSLTGNNVLESSLGTVPSANTANAANVAGFSYATAGLVHTSPITANVGDPDKSLWPVTNGFDVVLRCSAGPTAEVFLKNVSAGDNAGADGDEASGEGDTPWLQGGAGPDMLINSSNGGPTNIDELGGFAAFGQKGALSGYVGVGAGQPSTGHDCAANGYAAG